MNKYINMILLDISLKHKIFYMEKINYNGGSSYKTYFIKFSNVKEEFKSKRDLLIFLSDYIKRR